MYPELDLLTYRRHEQRLVQRLERRRVAEERAGSPASGGRGARDVAALLRGAGAPLAGWLARARHLAREVPTSTACCSAA